METIHFLTIVKDGMPWITHHLPVFQRLNRPWVWHIVEGTAAPVLDTSWCRPIPPGLSTDGTHEYLKQLRNHPRVRVYQSCQWRGKVNMVNAPLSSITEPCLLWEIDSDEVWEPETIENLATEFPKECNCIEVGCRYFVGLNLILTHQPGTYAQNPAQEWRRVWRFEPGMRFERHEPPVIANVPRKPWAINEEKIFDHYAYALESQVAFKEKYYGYPGAVEGWRRLQANKVWPAPLRDYFPWVKDSASVIPLIS